MPATVATRLVEGHHAIVLQNDHLRTAILPALGGRVWELTDRARDVQWIWHRPGVPLVAHDADAEYDAVWAGGWEELFPNDALGEFEGRQLPDHGEWWNRRWEVDAVEEGPAPCVRLSCRMTRIRARCTKEFRLDADDAVLSVRYRIESEEPTPFHFLFKQHLPLALGEACRLVVPGGTVRAVDPAFGSLLAAPGPVPWPAAGASAGAATDLRQVLPASSRTREFVYVSELRAPWCGMDDLAAGASLRLHWDLAALPFLWLFISYGGWRDVHTVVLEPCTNLPKDLAEAVRLGQAASLAPGGVFETGAQVRLSALRAD